MGMANQTVTDKTITVHGRGSLIIDYKVKDSTGDQVDISAWDLYFEVDGIPIREPLVSDPADPLGQRIVLERVQVAELATTPKKFVVVDETNSADDIYIVLWSGTIWRDGYKTNDATDE